MPPKESPSVYKRQKKANVPGQKKANVPVPAPQAEAPAAAPAPVPLVAVDKAAARAPVEKKPPAPVLPAAAAVAVPAPFSSGGEPIHPGGIVVEIVGTEMSCQGRSCEEHEICGEVLTEDVVVRLRKIQLMVEGKEETAIAAIWVTDGIDRCRVGFVPRHMAHDTTGRLRRSPVFLMAIRRPATRRSDACFLRTKGIAARRSSRPCRGLTTCNAN
jgi:hypothetical protein